MISYWQRCQTGMLHPSDVSIAGNGGVPECAYANTATLDRPKHLSDGVTMAASLSVATQLNQFDHVN